MQALISSTVPGRQRLTDERRKYEKYTLRRRISQRRDEVGAWWYSRPGGPPAAQCLLNGVLHPPEQIHIMRWPGERPLLHARHQRALDYKPVQPRTFGSTRQRYINRVWHLCRQFVER